MLVIDKNNRVKVMVEIKIKRAVAATPEQIRSVLLAHADLGRFFNAHFTLLAPQEPDEISGGKGTIREIKMQGTTFKEQIIAADNSHISYRIIGSKPVAQHRGDIYLNTINEEPSLTEVNYHISCIAPFWLPDFILAFFIKKDISQALKKIARYFQERVV
jgi:hypothetical protein